MFVINNIKRTQAILALAVFAFGTQTHIAIADGLALEEAIADGLALEEAIADGLALEEIGLALEEIVVTARKQEENLQTAPIAISAFSGQELEDIRGVVNITDIGAAAPNVNLSSSAPIGGSSAAPSIFIRGIGQQDFNNTADPGVGIYVDGIFVSRGVGGLLDIVDLERAEILRGPQGTLFGRNSIAGAINLISKKPDDTLAGKAAVTVGEDSLKSVKGSVNIPLTDNLWSRFSFLRTKQDGYVDAVQYNDFQLGEKDSLALRGSIRFEPTDDFTLDFAVDYSDSEESPSPVRLVSATPTGSVTSSGTPEPVAFNNRIGGNCLTDLGTQTDPACYGAVHNAINPYQSGVVFFDLDANVFEPENTTEILGIGLTMKWNLAIGELKTVTGYREVDASMINDADGSPHLVFQNNNQGFTNDSFSQEIQLVGSTLSDTFDYIIGAYYFEEDGVQDLVLQRERFTLTPAFAVPGNMGQIFTNDLRTIDNSSKAVFAQGTWHVQDDLHLTLGLRHTRDEKHVNFDLNRRDFIRAGPGDANFDGDYSIEVTDPLLTLGWDISDSVYGFFTYSEGFRDGGFPARFVGAVSSASAFDEEEVKSFEVGLKSSFLDDKLRVNLALFQTSYDNFQVAASSLDSSVITLVIDNLADVETSGMEAEIYWVATDNLRFDLSMGYLKNSIESLVGGGLVSAGQVITTSNELPYAPELSSNLGVTYLLPFNSGAELLTRLDWRYVDDQFFRIENTAPLSENSYNTVNLSSTYRTADDSWEFQVGFRNLTDSDHSTSAGAGGVGGIIANVARPRTGYATIRYIF